MSTAEQLKLLRLFHYVVGALHALVGSVGFFYFFSGLAILFAPDAAFASFPTPEAHFVSWACVFMGLAIILFGWTMALCTIVSGRYIGRRIHRIFSVTVGAVNCAIFPFGTALGTCDILLLTREDVRREYAV